MTYVVESSRLLFVMTPDTASPVFRVGRVEGWGQWGQSVTALIRGGRGVLNQGWRKKTLRRFVAKKCAQSTKFIRTTAVSVQGVGPARAAPGRKSTRVWDDDDGGAVVDGGRMGHEGL